MTRPKNTQSAEAALASSYAKPADYWRQFVTGGWIACKSPGHAINLRQRMYRARQLMQEVFGETPYDDLVIKLKSGENRLRIETRDEGVLELMPDDPQTVIETDEFVGIAKGDHPDAKP